MIKTLTKEEDIINNIKSFISFIENNNLYYYIGQTNEPDRRLKEHNKSKGFKELFVLIKHSKETIDYLEHYIISLYFDNKYCLNTQNYSKIIKNEQCFKPYKGNDFYIYVSLKEQIDIKNINKNISLINIYSIINKNNNISVISLLNDLSTLSKSTSSLSSYTFENSSSSSSIDLNDEELINDKYISTDINKKPINNKSKQTKTNKQSNQQKTNKQTKSKSLSLETNEIKQQSKQTKSKSLSLETNKTETKQTKNKEINDEKNNKQNKDNNKENKKDKKIIDFDKIKNTTNNLIQTINKNIIRREGVSVNKYLRIDLCKDYKYTMHKICYKKKIDDDNIKQLYKSSNDLELSYIFYELKKYYHYQKEIDIKLDNFFCFLSTKHSCKDNNIIYFYLF